MKRLPVLLIVLFLFFLIPSASYARYEYKGTARIQISASVGQYTLSVSGFISPYANVILTMPDGVFIRATVADSAGNFSISDVLIKRGFSGFCLEAIAVDPAGNFSISDVLIKRGFSGFCLEAIDFKRVGESTTCFSTPPAESSIVMRDLFLPPTLGLYRNQIAAGSTAIAFGYTMPYSTVILHLGSGEVLTTTSDGTGFYRFDIKGLKPGTYELFARAEYHRQLSLSPTKAIVLKALSLLEQLLAFLRDLLSKIARFITSVGLGPLWIGLPIIILIIILILKLWPERFTFIYENKLTAIFSRKPRRLHHWWFVGY
ncbi:MAG: hypothetical protein M1289_02210 [Patescibacteria group bacterium]|nr:hypothetical protein [Patescibacteria group bacterium]